MKDVSVHAKISGAVVVLRLPVARHPFWNWARDRGEWLVRRTTASPAEKEPKDLMKYGLDVPMRHSRCFTEETNILLLPAIDS